MDQATTCGDKDGGGAGTSAVSDADCGANYVYDPSKSAAACVGGKQTIDWTLARAGYTCGDDYILSISRGTSCDGWGGISLATCK